MTKPLFPTFKTRLPAMEGKTVVITGTTSGTGRVAALTLAELGAKVLVLNRPSERAVSAFSHLSKAFPEAEAHAIDCDLQSFTSVEEAAAKVTALCPEGVHALCNNAGVMALKDEATRDGFDVQMQTNHLSHFLLTRELFPLLAQGAESGEARIVNHSSVARMTPKKTLLPEYLEKKGGQLGGNGSALENALFRGPRWLRYNQSKLANCAFTAALHHKLQDKPIKALVAHPGFSNTGLQQTSAKHGGMGQLMTKMAKPFMQTMEDGAMGILSCMCLPEARSGQFWGPGSGSTATSGEAKPFALEPYYDNEATRSLLWQKSTEAISRDFVI